MPQKYKDKLIKALQDMWRWNDQISRPYSNRDSEKENERDGITYNFAIIYLN